MSKRIIIPKSMNQIKTLINFCDGFILGLKNLSVNLPFYFSLEQIKEILILCDINQKEVFINLNKNIHNSQLEELKGVLNELSLLKISGIIFYDVSIVNLNNKLNLKLNLIWNQEHMVTNYHTINYWNQKGVFASYLSSELTKEEVLNIRSNTVCPLMINVFGFIPMFTSKRHLINNYLLKFNLKSNSNLNYLEKEGNLYPIISDDVTTVYSSKILNLAQEIYDLEQSGINYLVFNSFNIDEEMFKNILILFNKITNENKKEVFNKINLLLNYNIDTGFFYKNTVYKVKKNG